MAAESGDYARTSPANLCILYLNQAARETEQALQNPQRWFFALPEMHRALNCALVAVLSGSAGFGAYEPKARRKWIAYFNEPNWPDLPAPTERRVQSFSALLERAQDPTEPELLGRPLRLSAEQIKDLSRLTAFRDDMEHVKPTGWSIETGGLPRILKAAADALSQLIDNRTHFILAEDDELDQARAAIAKIQAVANRHTSVPPQR